MEPGPSARFAPACLTGLAELGTIDAFRDDLSLELGLSLWLRRSGTSPRQAVVELLEIRRSILAVSGLDPAYEPVPLIGRSAKVDLLLLAAYVSHLLERAVTASGWSRGTLLARVVAALPEPEALGA